MIVGVIVAVVFGLALVFYAVGELLDKCNNTFGQWVRDE
jgi:hypothetical protein